MSETEMTVDRYMALRREMERFYEQHRTEIALRIMLEDAEREIARLETEAANAKTNKATLERLGLEIGMKCTDFADRVREILSEIETAQTKPECGPPEEPAPDPEPKPKKATKKAKEPKPAEAKAKPRPRKRGEDLPTIEEVRAYVMDRGFGANIEIADLRDMGMGVEDAEEMMKILEDDGYIYRPVGPNGPGEVIRTTEA